MTGPDDGRLEVGYDDTELLWTVDQSGGMPNPDEGFYLEIVYANHYEFSHLGTYEVSIGVRAEYTDDNTLHSDQEVYTFHVGPAADLELLDGGARPVAGGTAYTIIAVNNGPDHALDARVDVEGIPDGVGYDIVASEGTYDTDTHTWELGPLRHRDYRRAQRLPEGATLTITLRGGQDIPPAATISHDNENHPYTVCINNDDASDVTAASEADCPTATATWHTVNVYDHLDNNNTVVPGTGTPVALLAQQAGVVVRGGPLTVHESSVDGPVSADYTVVLGAQPTRDVTIRVANPNTGSLEVTPGSLTFNQVDWNTPKTVTVRAIEDDNAVDERLTLTHSASGDAAFRGLSIEGVNVRVDDDEPPELMLRRGDEEISALDLNEGGEPAVYEVSLSAQPRTSVVVDLGQEGNDPDYFQVNGRLDPRPLTFTSSNWNSPQRVTVRAPVDEDGDHESAVIVHSVTSSSSPEFRGLTAQVSVRVTDDDVPGVRVQPTALALAEGHARDSSKTYRVRLNVPPAADVTITLDSDNIGVAVDTDPATGAYENTLTFTPDNATIEQTVTVIALNDDNAQDETATISHTVSTTDNDYMSITVPSVTVTVTDDETPGITLSESALGIVEGINGATAMDSYTVAMAAEPTGSVTIDLSSDNGDVTVNPAMLTFTPSSGATPWNAPQTVTITVADDADSLPDTATITHAVNDAGSVDEYDGLAAELKVMVEDSDVPGLTFNPTSLSVEENATETYAVVLNVEPSLGVTVRISSSNSDVTVEPSTLTFTGGASGNWNVPQTVTVSAVVDSDETNDNFILTHRMDRSAAPEYRSKTVVLEGTVTETMVDYDTDGNGLIEIKTRQQLNAIRWDLDGDGKPDAGQTGNEDKEYRRAFPQYGHCQDGNGVPQDCTGYELMNDIALSGSWTPIPDFGASATLEGNGHTISGLSISRANDDQPVGMFAYNSGRVRNLGLEGVKR